MSQSIPDIMRETRMFSSIQLDPTSDTPLYKQLADAISRSIEDGTLRAGERLPATRELAGQLGVNRTTVSAAYSVLEEQGVVEGQVGRGSFVRSGQSGGDVARHWASLFPWHHAKADGRGLGTRAPISFASSRPCDDGFPLAEFRAAARAAIEGPEAADILQLGSPRGYRPLRDYLLGEARREGVARADDDLMITNGCQQALDLIARLVSESPAHGMAGPALNEPPAGVAIEDPVYHGLVRVFSRTAAELFGIPVDQNGMMPDALAAVLERQRPRLLVVTPSFQNPTGATMPISRRLQIVELAQRYGCVLVENDIYSALHYTAPPLPTLKELDTTGNTILLRSYSKVSFPGLRVGWIVAPWPAVARLAEVKETSDLHSDQLSQAVLLRFAESGELERHLQQTRKQGAERLQAALAASTRYLPPGTRWNPPSGGMNLWVQLPPSLTADGLLAAAEESGVDFLPGPHFSVRGGHARYLRISFGGLTPAQITRGIQILGQTASRLISAGQQRSAEEAAPALV